MRTAHHFIRPVNTDARKYMITRGITDTTIEMTFTSHFGSVLGLGSVFNTSRSIAFIAVINTTHPEMIATILTGNAPVFSDTAHIAAVSVTHSIHRNQRIEKSGPRKSRMALLATDAASASFMGKKSREAWLDTHNNHSTPTCISKPT